MQTPLKDSGRCSAPSPVLELIGPLYCRGEGLGLVADLRVAL
jgi:hypothetical protein